MSDLLPGFIVLAIGGSIAPPLLLLTILFLGSRRPLPNAAVVEGSITLVPALRSPIEAREGGCLWPKAQWASSLRGRCSPQ
jgi:hypothetical protein